MGIVKNEARDWCGGEALLLFAHLVTLILTDSTQKSCGYWVFKALQRKFGRRIVF